MSVDTRPIPVPLNIVPEKVRNLVDPERPESSRVVVAKAAIPLPMEELLVCLAYLTGDLSERVRDQAQAGLRSLPKGTFSQANLRNMHPGVLDTVARHIQDSEILTRIVINDSTGDATLNYLATFSTDHVVLESIGLNQNRLARHPPLVEALFFNAATPMTTAQRIIEFAVRQRLPISHFPGYEMMVENIMGKDFAEQYKSFNITPLATAARAPAAVPEPEPEPRPPAAAESQLEDDEEWDEDDQGDPGEDYPTDYTQDLMDDLDGADDFDEDTFSEDEDTYASAEDEADDLVARLEMLQLQMEDVEDVVEVLEQQGPLGKSILNKIASMNVAEKTRLALTGNATVRGVLIADHYMSVALSVLANPGLTLKEIAMFAMNRHLSDDIIRRIAGNRKWTQNYQVKLGLVQNPKTPIPLAMSFIKYLTKKDLKSIATSRDVMPQISKMAKQQLNKVLG